MQTLSETNRNASYSSITPNMLNKTQLTVLECIRRVGDQTTEQLAAKLPYKKSSIIARVHELRQKMVLTEKGSLTIHNKEAHKSYQTLYGEFESPEARRSAIDHAWAQKVDQRNNIVEELNNIKTEGKAKSILRKEYEHLTKDIHILEHLK